LFGPGEEVADVNDGALGAMARSDRRPTITFNANGAWMVRKKLPVAARRIQKPVLGISHHPLN
jgi:hypothetical protein